MASSAFSAFSRLSGSKGAFPMTGLIQDMIGGSNSIFANEHHERILDSSSGVRFIPSSVVCGSCLATKKCVNRNACVGEEFMTYDTKIQRYTRKV